MSISQAHNGPVLYLFKRYPTKTFNCFLQLLKICFYYYIFFTYCQKPILRFKWKRIIERYLWNLLFFYDK